MRGIMFKNKAVAGDKEQFKHKLVSQFFFVKLGRVEQKPTCSTFLKL